MNQAKKKILSIAHWYPNKNNPFKGVFIKNHMEAICAFSETVLIDFCIENSSSIYKKEVTRKTTENGLDVLHLHVKSKFYKFLYYSLIFQSYILKRELKKNKIEVNTFDLIISHVIFPSGIIGYKLARKHKKPLVLIEHWTYFDTFFKKDIHRNKGKKALEYAQKIIVVSELLKKVVSNHCSIDKIVTVPNIISDRFGYLPKVSNQNKNINFLAISTWKSPKNPFPYIKALEAISKTGKYPSFELTLIGNGPQLEQIKAMNLSFPVNYIGSIKNELIPVYFKNANFFLHGSDYETFSIVGVEALTTGTPVLYSPVGILPEIVHEKNGVICENNVESWINGLENVFSRTYNYLEIAEEQKNKFSKEKVQLLFKMHLS